MMVVRERAMGRRLLGVYLNDHTLTDNQTPKQMKGVMDISVPEESKIRWSVNVTRLPVGW